MDDILNILRLDASTPHDKIAKRLGLPVETVTTKIKAWEENGTILAYTTIINPENLNESPNVMAMIEVRITPEREGGFDKIARRISRFSEVKSCYLMSGGFDLMVVVEGKNLRQVAEFVSERLATIQGILSTRTHFILKPYKQQGVYFQPEETPERLNITP